MPQSVPLSENHSHPHQPPDPQPVSFSKVFADERHQIAQSRQARGINSTKDVKDSLIGLAFSGGGIRSATFNLGVLQALAQKELLHKFDYLSTVSGGGYIGSWLAGVTQRQRLQGSGFSEVEQSLRQQTYQVGGRAEGNAIHWLRKYADYLTPQMGLLSADTGAMVGTWLRNVILNLMVVVLFLLGIILLPSVVVLFNWNVLLLYPGTTFFAGVALIVVATVVMAISMTDFGSDRNKDRNWFQRNRVWFAVMLPVFVAAWFLNGAIWIWQDIDNGTPLRWALLGALFYGSTWLLGSLVLQRPGSERGESAAGEKHKDHREHKKKLIEHQVVSGLGLTIAAAVAGAIAGVLFYSYSSLLAALPINYDDIWIVVIWGTVVVVLLMLLTAVLQIGLLGRDCFDLVREWWSREGGQLLISVLVWVSGFSVVIFGPLGVLYLMNHAHTRTGKGLNVSALLVWVISSIAGILAGKSPLTSDDKKLSLLNDAGVARLLKSTRAMNLIAKVAPYIFVTGLLILLSTAVHIFAGMVFEPDLTRKLWLDKTVADVYDSYWAIQSSPGQYWYVILLAAIGLTGVALVLSWRIDVNDFSMHHFYRNRLVRCYLGASNPDREPQQFTGFDPKDDIPLSDLADGYPGLYPILNASLNTSRGRDLGFEERKARSFVFTPLYCGYDPSSESFAGSGGSYLPTAMARHEATEKDERWRRKKTITLGTAMAISGAAASPNMGHYTSPPTAFFMTLFDVRLGWWMGNPNCVKTWRRPGPVLGLAYLLSELIARSDENSKFVYLSDGGHFENLAMYELVKRRCRLIVVCDSGADGSYACGDLMSAIEKCRTDFGVDIKISVADIRPAPNACVSTQSFTLGDIHYGPDDIGKLIYLKASLPVDDAHAPLAARLAAGVRSYADSHKGFPHQSTANQWFDEVQFEAYRALGEYIGTLASRDIGETIEVVLEGQAQKAAGGGA